MANRMDVPIGPTQNPQFYGAGTNYVVQTLSGALYVFYINNLYDLYYRKSLDRGKTWAAPVLIRTGSVSQISVWYDRWSSIAADIIHMAYEDDSVHDVFYRNLNTASDTLSTQYTIYAGASQVSYYGTLSITRARGGNLGCIYSIDAAAEYGFKISTDVGVNWTAKTDTYEATTDMCILLPGWAADNQDLMMFYWDASADEISRKLFDNSANSWAESSIAGTMADTGSASSYPHFAAAVDITNSRNLLVAWSAVDSANADLRCWYITEGAITEVTNVVLNSTDDQGLCAIGIDTVTNYWYVFYGGKSDGSETWNSAVNIYYKVSQDAGTTWGAETQLSYNYIYLYWLACTPRFISDYNVAFYSLTHVNMNINAVSPRATYQLGL